MNRIVLVLCVLLAFFGNARTYYVSKEGKNNNPGSKVAPFQTIQFEINKLNVVSKYLETTYVVSNVVSKFVRRLCLFIVFYIKKATLSPF